MNHPFLSQEKGKMSRFFSSIYIKQSNLCLRDPRLGYQVNRFSFPLVEF